MTAQEAILEILEVLDEGNRQIEEVVEVHGIHSLKAGDLIERVERSIVFRISEVIRQFDRMNAEAVSEESDT